MVFLAPEPPLSPRPSLSADGNVSFTRGGLPILRSRASAGLLADNFLDVAHFPFIHANTFGADEAQEVPSITWNERAKRLRRVMNTTPLTAMIPASRKDCVNSFSDDA